MLYPTWYAFIKSTKDVDLVFLSENTLPSTGSLHPYKELFPLNWNGNLPGLVLLIPKYMGLISLLVELLHIAGTLGPTFTPPQISLIQIQSRCSPCSKVSFVLFLNIDVS